MATAQDVLRTLVRLEGADNYVNGLRAIGTTATATADKVSDMANRHKQLSVAMAGMATASAGILGYMVRQADSYERYRQKLEIATKSQQKANQIFEAAKQYANVTPFSTGGVVDAAARLEMYGMTAAKWLPLAGDMAGAMSKDITQAVEAIADAISGGGLERLKEFGIGSQQLKGAGWTGSYQDTEGIESLKKALETLISNRFMGGAARMSETLSGKLSTLQGEAETLAATMGKDLLPEFGAMINNATNLVKWLNGTSSSTRGMVTEGLKIALIGGVVAGLTFKIKAMILEYKANQIAVAAATKTQQAETIAVREGVVAYNEKAEALIKAREAEGGASAPTGGTLGKAKGFLKSDSVKMGAQIIGTTMAINSASKVDWSDPLDYMNGSFDSLAKTIGYTVGAFNPLILAATLLADVIGRVYEGYINRKAEEITKAAEAIPGMGPNGPLDEEGLRRQYEEGVRLKQINPEGVPYEKWREGALKSAERAMAESNRKMLEAQQERERKQLAEQTGIASAYGNILGNRSEQARMGLKGMRGVSSDAEAYLRNAAEIEAQSMRVAAALHAEALQQQYIEGGLRRQAALTKDTAEKYQLLDQAERAHTNAMKLETDAQSVLAEHKSRLAKANDELAKEQDRRAEEVRRREKEAYDLARQALQQYKDEMRQTTDAMREGMDVGAAYVEYLRAIGKEKAATAYERSAMAGMAAQNAQAYFMIGETAQGWRAAAQAEKYARSGMNSGTGSIAGNKDVPYAGRALTNAIPTASFGAMARMQPLVELQNRIIIQDGFVNGMKVKLDLDRRARFEQGAE